jgi:hypothetical protein
MLRMGIPEEIVNPVMGIYDGGETAIVTPGGQSAPIEWRSGTVQACQLSGEAARFNICIEPFLRLMEQKVSSKGVRRKPVSEYVQSRSIRMVTRRMGTMAEM